MVSNTPSRSVENERRLYTSHYSVRTGADVGHELVNRLGGEELGEEHGPVGLDLDARALDERVHLLSGHFLAIIGKDEGSVGAGKVTGHISARRMDGLWGAGF